MGKPKKRVALRMLEEAYISLGHQSLADQIAAGSLQNVPLSVAMKAVDLALDSIATVGEANSPASAMQLEIATRWCDQCDKRVSLKEADFCRSRWCGARP